jgi:hypothetical protein
VMQRDDDPLSLRVPGGSPVDFTAVSAPFCNARACAPSCGLDRGGCNSAQPRQSGRPHSRPQRPGDRLAP